MSFPVGQVIDQIQPVLGVGPGGLPPGDASATSDPYANYNAGQAPGLGGKAGGPFAQIPIDMQGNLLDGNPSSVYLGRTGGTPEDQYGNLSGMPVNLPQPKPSMPLGSEQGGTPGRPVPAAPFTPAGPGFANPGAPGVGSPGAGGKAPASADMTQMQQKRPLTGNFQPIRQPVAPAPAPTAPIVSQRARVPRQAPQSMKIGRGAGRGGLLR